MFFFTRELLTVIKKYAEVVAFGEQHRKCLRQLNDSENDLHKLF